MIKPTIEPTDQRQLVGDKMPLSVAIRANVDRVVDEVEMVRFVRTLIPLYGQVVRSFNELDKGFKLDLWLSCWDRGELEVGGVNSSFHIDFENATENLYTPKQHNTT